MNSGGGKCYWFTVNNNFCFALSQDHEWDEKTKSLVLSSFFWGYVVTQVPAGQLAQKFGAKRILMWSMLLCAALTLLTPLSITYGGWKVCYRFFSLFDHHSRRIEKLSSIGVVLISLLPNCRVSQFRHSNTPLFTFFLIEFSENFNIQIILLNCRYTVPL